MIIQANPTCPLIIDGIEKLSLPYEALCDKEKYWDPPRIKGSSVVLLLQPEVK